MIIQWIQFWQVECEMPVEHLVGDAPMNPGHCAGWRVVPQRVYTLIPGPSHGKDLLHAKYMVKKALQVWLRILRERTVSNYLSGPNVITRVLSRECTRIRVRQKVRGCRQGSERRGNAVLLALNVEWKLGPGAKECRLGSRSGKKKRKQILPQKPTEGGRPADTLTLPCETDFRFFYLQNCKRVTFSCLKPLTLSRL